MATFLPPTHQKRVVTEWLQPQIYLFRVGLLLLTALSQDIVSNRSCHEYWWISTDDNTKQQSEDETTQVLTTQDKHRKQCYDCCTWSIQSTWQCWADSLIDVFANRTLWIEREEKQRSLYLHYRCWDPVHHRWDTVQIGQQGWGSCCSTRSIRCSIR